MHDSCAALLRDGKIAAIAEEERFNRIKHSWYTFPENAINFCLEKEGIKLRDIDHIAYYFDQNLMVRNFWRFQPYFSRLISKPWVFFGALYMKKKDDAIVERIAKKANAKLHFIEHHIAHASSSYYGSEFKKANILSIDGRGELTATLLAEGNNDCIRKIHEIPLPHSAGEVYSAVTDFLGLVPQHGEGETMGLSSYGKNIYSKQMDKIIWKTPDGFCTDPSYYWGFIETWGEKYAVHSYTQKMRSMFGEPFDETALKDPINNHYEHIAASLQARIEEIGSHLVDIMHERTGYKKLCVAGGVGLNSKMNGKLLMKDNVDEIYINPAAADNGAALGAAYYVYHEITGKRPEPLRHAFYGPEYSDDEIKKCLDKCKAKYEKHSDISGAAAESLAKGKIVGWFNGRMELGPRALGARSILANPSNAETKDIINKFVKGRQWWRPFALSMTYGAKDKYLAHRMHSPFMILVDDVPKEKQQEVIAGVHVDGTTRPQTLEKQYNPAYYKLIEEFGKETGIPVVLNTSFNLRGEPIVCTPQEALKDFFASGMDTLAIGSFLIAK